MKKVFFLLFALLSAMSFVSCEKADTISSVYSLTGVKQQGMQKGLNIIRYSNGKTAKILNAR